MGARMCAFDWSTSPVGPAAQWPQSLKTAVSICIGSRYPIVLWWGNPAYTMFYNDGYIPILGVTKHPGWLGRSGRECWKEIWSTMGPMLDSVFETGEATWSEDLLLVIDRAKTAFFSNVSHEFRTPLTLMLGPLEDALATPSLPEEMYDRLDVAHRNSIRLLKLVNTLLDFSRLEAGRTQGVFESIDLATLTAELASVFRSAIERAGLSLVVECSPIQSTAYVDREMWEKIEMHGGEIQATSRGKGKGSKFTLRLPVIAASAADERADEREVQSANVKVFSWKQQELVTVDSTNDLDSGLLSGLKILIVDDQHDTRELISVALGRYGAEVRVSESASSALKMIEEWKPHVVVSDIGLPDVDGYDFMRQLRELEGSGQRIPAIAVTGYAGAVDESKALDAGYEVHLSKPIELSELASAIARLSGRA